MQEEVTLQCDALQSGLGAAMMQNGQPVAYASRALTSAETRYAQIEKELLAVVFACDHFDAYIYGRSRVNIETDTNHWNQLCKNPSTMLPRGYKECYSSYKNTTCSGNTKKEQACFLQTH